jgi:hypothetical protein
VISLSPAAAPIVPAAPAENQEQYDDQED